MPNNNKLLLKLEGSWYAILLDVNIEYYNIRHRDNSSNLWTNILPGVKYCYTLLTMGIDNTPDIFQQQMNDLFLGFELIRFYIDDL